MFAADHCGERGASRQRGPFSGPQIAATPRAAAMDTILRAPVVPTCQQPPGDDRCNDGLRLHAQAAVGQLAVRRRCLSCRASDRTKTDARAPAVIAPAKERDAAATQREYSHTRRNAASVIAAAALLVARSVAEAMPAAATPSRFIRAQNHVARLHKVAPVLEIEQVEAVRPEREASDRPGAKQIPGAVDPVQ